MMSDSDQGEKKPGVPSWQLKAKDEPAKTEEKLTPEPPSRETIIEQAKKFLEEDEVRNASTDKKIAFLESKGLQKEEIHDLLGVSKNPEASSSETQQSQPTQQSPQPPSPQQQSPSQPPIITYPEFLTTPTSATPLITKTRLITTLYLFSGLSALLYGTNTYLLTPMLASLTESRLSLAETASSNLSKLITQLEGMVSEIPTTPLHKHGSEYREEDEESDEDPTELFHRDIGVQTSLPNSEAGSRPGSPSPNTPNSVLADQTSRLKSLKDSLSGLVEVSQSEGHDVAELEATIGVLREQLDNMSYVVPNYGFSGVGGYGSGNSGTKENDDEISRVKAGIKSMKGVLLSARSFPGGVRAVGSR